MSTSSFLTRNDLINIIDAIFPATSEDMTDAQIEAFINSVQYNLQNQVDYIVEQGTSGSWTYRKWSSGISEAWYNATVSPSMTTAYGGIYISPAYSVTTPSGLFISPPSVQAELAMQGGVGGASVSSVSATTIAGYFFNGSSYNASSKQLQFNIYARGNWK